MKKIYDYLIKNVYPSLFAATFVPLAEMSNSSRLGDLYSSQSLATYFQRLFDFAIALGAIIAVLRLMIAGYYYMGSDVVGNKGTAKAIISDVFLGLFLLLGAWIMLKQINPNILNLNVLQNMKAVPAVQSSTRPSTAPAATPEITRYVIPEDTGRPPTPAESLTMPPM